MQRQLLETAGLPWKVPPAWRNTLLDYLFYDVGSLSPAETGHLVTQLHHEGALLLVQPGAGLKCFDSLRDLKNFGQLPRQFSVAGVGSSALGAAALARNVADATGQPVCAIVAGYGMLDLLTEALGGWLFYGAGNAWHQSVDNFLKWTEGIPLNKLASLRHPEGQKRVPRRDDEILGAILADRDFQPELLVGHSKGALSIAETLFRVPTPARSITLGAVCEFPDAQEVHQFLGLLDTFGAMNSRWGVSYQPVWNAWHHLNTSLPCHCDAVGLVKRALQSK